MFIMGYYCCARNIRGALSLSILFFFAAVPNSSEALNYSSLLAPIFVSNILADSSQSTDSGEELDLKIRSLVEQISRNFDGEEKNKIAVCTFVNLDGGRSDFGVYLAEELITLLFQTGRFEVVERRLLDKVLAEQKLSATGALDATSVQRLGSILGVETIVTGTLTDLSFTIRVNARIISARDGTIFAAASETFSKTDDIQGLISSDIVVHTDISSNHTNNSLPVVEKDLPDIKKPSLIYSDERFMKYDNGVITDQKTRMEWHIGPEKINLHEAKGWAANLTTDGGGWRLPTLEELKGIYQKGAGVMKGFSEHNRSKIFEPCGAFIWAGDNEVVRDYSFTINGHPLESTANGFNFDSGVVEQRNEAKSKNLLYSHGVFAVRNVQKDSSYLKND